MKIADRVRVLTKRARLFSRGFRACALLRLLPRSASNRLIVTACGHSVAQEHSARDYIAGCSLLLLGARPVIRVGLVGLILAAMITFVGFVSFPQKSSANEPSLHVYYVNVDGLVSLVETHFSDRAAARVQKDLEHELSPHTWFKHPYGDEFRAVRGSLDRILQQLLHDETVEGGMETFEKFLDALNKGPYVRAMMSSPDYSGCMIVVIELSQEGAMARLRSKSSPYQFRGCRSR